MVHCNNKNKGFQKFNNKQILIKNNHNNYNYCPYSNFHNLYHNSIYKKVICLH